MVVLTKDIPKLNLYVGMKGSVEKVVLHQRIEVLFFF